MTQTQIYHSAVMSRLLGHGSDPASLAAVGTVIEETIDVGEFSRLVRLLESTEGGVLIRLAFSLAGGRGGLPLLDGEVTAQLSVLCQRCLGPVSLPVKTQFHLALVDDEAQCDGVQPPYEPVLKEHDETEGRGLGLLALVEDELLLSLPMCPMHEPENECGEIEGGVSVSVDSDGDQDNQTPFAGLKDLLDDKE